LDVNRPDEIGDEEPREPAGPAGDERPAQVVLLLLCVEGAETVRPRTAASHMLRFDVGEVSARAAEGALLVPLGMFARLRRNPLFEVIRAGVVGSLVGGR